MRVRLLLLVGSAAWQLRPSAAQPDASGCTIEVPSLDGPLLADASLFGPHLPLHEAGQQSALRYVSSSCWHPCGAPTTDCIDAMALIGSHWVLTERPDGLLCDGSLLTALAQVRAAQVAGAIGVILIEADDASPEERSAASSDSGLTIPSLWIGRADAADLLAVTEHSTSWSQVYVTPQCSAIELVPGAAVPFRIAPGRTVYLYHATAAASALLLHLAAYFGSPTLHMTHTDGQGTVAELAATPLPSEGGALLSGSPGQPFLQVHAATPSPDSTAAPGDR